MIEQQVRDALLAIEGVQTIDSLYITPLRSTFIVSCEMFVNTPSFDVAKSCLMALYELLPRPLWVSPAFTLKNDGERWNYAYNQHRKRWQIINLLTHETIYTGDDL